MNRNIILKEFFKEVFSYFKNTVFYFTKYHNYSYNIGFDKCVFNFTNIINNLSINGRYSIILDEHNFYGLHNFCQVMKYLELRSFFESE